MIAAAALMAVLVALASSPARAGSVAGVAVRAAVAVLPVAPHVTGMPYAPLPSAGELDGLTATLAHDLRARHVALVGGAAVARAVRRAGFDQHDPQHACLEAACARRIGVLLGARSVIVSSTTREMAMIWATDALVVDVASGRSQPLLQAGYKGDYTTMQVGLDELAGALARHLGRVP